MNAEALKDRLVAHARELGFDSCRIASSSAPRHANEFRAWLDAGAAGDMQWMERAQRSDAIRNGFCPVRARL
jgi:epoxyqueuosine reductase